MAHRVAPGPSLSRERAAWAEQRLLVGVDEAGRGPLAGPVVAAAVVFPAGARRIRGVRDSKTLPMEKRNALAVLIRGAALALGVGAASAREIDHMNIRVATALAMRRALARLLWPDDRRLRSLRSRPRDLAEYTVVVDGLPFPEIGVPHDALVDGDALCYSVSAAGIIAKTVRDRLMLRLAERYTGFGWRTNMGYATAEHMVAIDRHGPTVHHRKSFAPCAQLGLGLLL